MQINPHNLLSINEILADVLVGMDDEDQSKLTPGFYRAQVKYAMDELGFDVFFLPQTVDVPMPIDLLIDMPKGCYNLTDINIYTGTPDNVGYVENLYWKKNMRTRGAGTGYTANVHSYNVTDPFFRVNVWESGRYFFTVQNGIIRLSDTCADYPYVRMTFNGLASKNLDEVKMVPPEVRKAVVLWVIEKGAGFLKSRLPNYRVIQIDASSQLDEYGLNGAWHEAKMRLRRLDTKIMRDVITYNSSLLST